MTESAFFHKLALERCQFAVAQLSAAVSVTPLMNAPAFSQTFLTLLDSMNRDLSMLNEGIEESGWEPSATDVPRVVNRILKP